MTQAEVRLCHDGQTLNLSWAYSPGPRRLTISLPDAAGVVEVDIELLDALSRAGTSTALRVE